MRKTSLAIATNPKTEKGPSEAISARWLSRSETMRAVRSSGNLSTELRLVTLLRKHGLTGWRRGVPLPGRPDFVFRASKVVVFVDGCFWHGCPRHASMPTNNRPYWLAKLARNKTRDRAVGRTLRAAGWRVIRVWECALTRRNAATLRRIARALGPEEDRYSDTPASAAQCRSTPPKRRRRNVGYSPRRR